MAAPTYSHDLANISVCDALGTWVEATGFIDGTAPVAESDYYIQLTSGTTGCISKPMGNSTSAASGSIFNYGSGLTITAPNAVFAWVYFAAPNALATQANGGLRFLVGSANGTFKQYYVRGSNTYPYGGWLCIPFHPSIETGAATISVNATNATFTRSAGDFTANGFEPGMTIMTTGFTNAGNNTTKVILSVSTTVITVTSNTGLVTETGGGDEWVRQCDNLLGSPTTTAQWFGGAAVLSGSTAVSKGNPFGLDAFRYGRGESRMYDGDSGSPASFAGFASNTNDTTANRLGLIQAVDGGYLIQGKIVLGYSAPVYFKQENTSVLIANTEKVVSSFNAIEIRQPSGTSTVIMNSVSFLALNANARGNWITTDNATVTLNSCTFTAMGTFSFQSNTTVTTCSFRRCKEITGGGAALNSCTISNGIDAVSLVLTNLNQATGCTFESDGTNHAVDLGTISASTAMNWNNYLTNYAVSDGSSGNEAIKVNVASSQVLTINVGSGYSTPSVYNTGSGTVTVVSGQVTTSITVKALSDGSNISGARVLVWATTNVNKLPNAVTSITGSGTTATVSQTGHGLATGDYVIISGVTNDDDYNGVHQITKINDNSYSYTADDTLVSPATGTIVAKWAIISGTTNASGYIEDIRSFASAQPIQGWVRKTSGSPYYQQGVISGTINTSSGFDTTIQLATDE